MTGLSVEVAAANPLKRLVSRFARPK
jgi:hypothetical protein